jgi:hypothetical protein
MSEVLDLPVVRAVSKAYVQHEVWLASIGCGGVLGKVNPVPHPFAGRGVTSWDVTDVLVMGAIHPMWWRERMYAHGLDTFMQLPYDDARALTDRWSAEMPVVRRGEVVRTAAALKRAARLGLVVGEKLDGRWCWRPA